MTPLEIHRRKKAALAKWYDTVLAGPTWLAAGVLSEAERASLAEAKANLLTDRFVVAVCGQMKAGKSTLLNALIFGEPVLPAAATVMTAKITLMEGAKQPAFEATLYTPVEFDQVVKSANADTQASSELASAREAARRAGISEAKVLQSPAKVERRSGLGSLLEFCGVPAAGGLYTPYVKSVHLWADQPWLHAVTVADTPGSNDPNPERDRVTKEWINQADAVVFVTYAGQAGLDANDVAFVDAFLGHINPEKRIIAVNKVDLVDDNEAILRHFRNLGNQPDLRKQELFGKDSPPPVLVSGLAGLIAALQAGGRRIPPALAEDAAYLEDNGWLAAQRHGLGMLRSEIESRIIRTKGDALLGSHRRKLEDIFARADRHFEGERQAARDAIAAAKATEAEVAAELQKIKESAARTDRVVDGARQALTATANRVQNAIQDQLDALAVEIADGVITKIKDVKSFDNIASHAVWAIPSVLKQHRPRFRSIFQEASNVFEAALCEQESRVSEELLKFGLGDHDPAARRIGLQATGLLEEVIAKATSELDGERFAALAEGAANVLRRWVNTAAARRDAVERLQPLLERTVQDALDELKAQFAQKYLAATKQVVEALAGDVGKINHRRQQELKAVQVRGADRARMAREADAAAKRWSASLDELTKVRSDFSASLEIQ